jgi:uncharacterized membrane protein YhaH (DUF805 family)|uniref:DUF805 domain-containing protein n=1 Tax=Alloprevotella sp. TaxID=1872471 RepID=UPI00402A5BF1
MGLFEAVKSVFSKYATFQGRASRSEYWFFYLFNILLEIGLLIVGLILGAIVGDGTGALAGMGIAYVLLCIYGLIALIPSISVFVRRMHDIGRSGWWYWLALVPLVGVIVLLVFLLTGSDRGDNQYGPEPL